MKGLTQTEKIALVTADDMIKDVYRGFLTYPLPQPIESWSVIQNQESEIGRLKQEIAQLKSEFKHLVEKHPDEPRVIHVIEVPLEDAKKMISDYLAKHKSADMEELQNNLHLNLETIYLATKQLEQEGKLKSKPC